MNPVAQRVGDMVLAAVGDHLAQSASKSKASSTVAAFVEMMLDLLPTIVGELAVEIV